MKLRALIVAILLATAVCSQTNVSGGIYTNTVWSKANSPYIVTSTVVVFPGISLTIEPGVTVKFYPAQGIEVRQGKIIAVGTAADSITFTWNAWQPGLDGIFVHLNGGNMMSQFDYCRFESAHVGIYFTAIYYDALVRRSLFRFSHCGVYFNGAGACSIEDCRFADDLSLGIGDDKVNIVNTLTVSNCDLLGNPGIGLAGNGSLLINSSYFHGPSGLVAKGTTTVSGSTFYKNKNAVSLYSEAHIINCAFISNSLAISGATAGAISGNVISSNTIGLSQLTGLSVTNNTINANRDGIWQVLDCSIKNNVIDSNERGVRESPGSVIESNHLYHNKSYAVHANGNVIQRNTIRYNGIGITAPNPTTLQTAGNVIQGNIIESDSLGLEVGFPKDHISCNRIVNNTTYNLKYSGWYTLPVADYTKNEWGSSDSATIAAKIYDGKDDIWVGLVDFMPVDAASCYQTVSIAESARQAAVRIFPNPTNGTFSVVLPPDLEIDYSIVNEVGLIVRSGRLSAKGSREIKPDCAPGLYLFYARAGNEIFLEKLVITR